MRNLPRLVLDDRLQAGLEGLDWPARTMTAQKQWIRRSTGTQIVFPVQGSDDESVTVFTIRADTLLGVTHVTLAAEHPLVSSISTADQNKQVDNCAAQTSSRSNLDRTTAKEKTGVFAGGYGIHPISGDHIPVWVGDYVLGSYGTGAVMAVPAHDTRDFEFAQKFDLDIKWVVIVIKPQKGELNAEQAFAEYGVAMNSGQGLDDLSTSECKIVMTKKLEDISKGEPHDHIRMQI